MQFHGPVTFTPYSEKELLNILEDRVGREVVANTVLDYVAKTTAKGSGDARRALEMLSRTIQSCLDQTPKDAVIEGEIVTMKHLLPVIQDRDASIKARVEGLPLAGKVILCVLSSIATGGVTSTSVGILRNCVRDCLHSSNSEDDIVGIEDFVCIIDTLVDTGLLIANKNLGKKLKADLYSQEIRLGDQLGEVTRLLKNELDKPFYNKLRENAADFRYRL